MELPALPVLAPQVLQALAVSVQQELRAQLVQELQAQQELAPQEPRALLAYKAQRVLALTAPLVQLEQPAQEQQVLLARLALPVLKAQRAPSASALAQPAPQVLALRVQQGYRVQQVLQVQLAPLVLGQPALLVW